MNPQLPPLEFPPEQKPKGRLRQMALYVLMATIGGLLGAMLSISIVDMADSAGGRSSEIIVLLLIIPIFFLTIALHEVGHLVAGWLVGFKFYSVQVGPLRLARTPSGMKLDTQWALALAGGMAVSYAATTENLKRRALRYYAGGPLASLVSFLIALTVFALNEGWPQEPMGPALADLPVLFFIGNSLLITVLTLIPSRMMGMASDGARIFSILLNTPRAKRDLALFALFGLSHSGVRPRDWDLKWIDDLLVSDGPNFMTAVAYASAYTCAIDREAHVEAREYLQSAIDAIETRNFSFRPSLMLEAVYYEAAIRGDYERAKEWRQRIPTKAPLDPVKANRADAALQLVSGNGEIAKRRIAAAREALAQSLDLGTRAAESELLDKLEAELIRA